MYRQMLLYWTGIFNRFIFYHMNEQYNDVSVTSSSAEQTGGSRGGSAAFYALLTTLVLAPLAFLPTPYVSLDVVKTTFIVLGALISVLLYVVSSYRSRSFILPPRGVLWSGIAVVASLIISTFVGGHADKSFFGQGFEIDTASFLIVLLLLGIAALGIIRQKPERTVIAWVGITSAFLVLVLFHVLRFIIGPTFLSFGILPSVVSTIVGSWNDIAIYGIVISCMALPALMFLPLSRKIRIVYSALLVLGLLAAFIVNSAPVWFAACIVFATFVVFQTISKSQTGTGVSSFFKRIAWLPLVIACLAGILTWKGVPIAKPAIDTLGAEYTTLSLPWQISLDVTAGALKESPLFGVGPNRFTQAYIVYKPLIVNTTDAWGTEFSYAFGLIPTFLATQGILGMLAWILLMICVIASIIKMLRSLPSDPQARFVVASLSMAAAFLWIISILIVPSHTMVLFAAFATAAALGAGVAYGLIRPATSPSLQMSRFSTASFVVAVALCAIWIVWYGKGAIALAYFGSGAKALSVSADTVAADRAFAQAYFFDPSDIYLRARAETGIVKANQIASTITQNMPASTSQELIGQVVDTVNAAAKYAEQAITSDNTNYYNYLSEARVSELAANVRMDKGYDTAVAAYTRAIQLNQWNPSLYLSLARLQASQNKLDDAQRTLGAALQVKNNYLDAIFLLSQVAAAQGNLKDAITAATVASQINPQNPIIWFQLGLLQYNNKDYSAAAKAMESALAIQADYANVQYFLGLSYVRLNRMGDAVAQFERLAATNPDNQEVAFILTNLRAGKSPFADAQPPVTPNPEKRPSLPIKQKK